MDPGELKAAIEAVCRAAQPRDDDVIAWNQGGDQRLSDVLTCLFADR
jgi:hypothetical protein